MQVSVYVAAEDYMSAATVIGGMIEHAPEDMLDLFYEPLSVLPSNALEVGF